MVPTTVRRQIRKAGRPARSGPRVSPPPRAPAAPPRPPADGWPRRGLLGLAPGLLLAPALIPAPAGASTTAAPPPANPANLTSSDRLANPDALLAAGVAGGVPGLVLRVDRGGAPLFSGAAGVASQEGQTPVQEGDRFRIYSIAKTFTATVVLQLVDAGVLSLEDTVRRWLDGPTVGHIPHVESITLRQLLTHTSGIYDYQDEADSPFYQDAFFGPGADWARVWTPPELLAYADGARHAPYFAPGQGVAYANTNYVLLGLVVEAATGRPFRDALRDRVLAPLALDRTSLEEGAALAPDVVPGYQVQAGQLVDVSAVNLTWAWAAGGVVSTAADLARFARAVFGGELLSPAAHAAMFTFVPGAQGRLEFGMGVYRVPSPNGELIGMDGGGAGGTSTMTRLPGADVTVVALANVAGEGGLDHLRDEAFAWALA
jgi:D-alanyl-D-alanine carboxypeptidase